MAFLCPTHLSFFFPAPLTISHPIFPLPSDAHSPKTPSYYEITGLLCECVYVLCY